MSSKQLVLVLPEKIYIELEKIQRKTGIKIEDLLMRSIIKVIEEFGGE